MGAVDTPSKSESTFHAFLNYYFKGSLDAPGTQLQSKTNSAFYTTHCCLEAMLVNELQEMLSFPSLKCK